VFANVLIYFSSGIWVYDWAVAGYASTLNCVQCVEKSEEYSRPRDNGVHTLGIPRRSNVSVRTFQLHCSSTLRLAHRDILQWHSWNTCAMFLCMARVAGINQEKLDGANHHCLSFAHGVVYVHMVFIPGPSIDPNQVSFAGYYLWSQPTSWFPNYRSSRVCSYNVLISFTQFLSSPNVYIWLGGSV
jgi:hypothetical protein